MQTYIGTRDFFPKESRYREWMFSIQRKVCALYGYEEYGSPLLEYLDLYQSKSSEEIVDGQIYSFQDRGKRNVAIRPEMTPSIARMINLKERELPFPIRWYSIANFMRYERPGRGRLREFFQLNTDLVGISSPSADAEIMMIAIDILRSYGASDEDFEVGFSDRRILNSYLQIENKERFRRVIGVLDKRNKIDKNDFARMIHELAVDVQEEKKIHGIFDMELDDFMRSPLLDEEGRQASQELSQFNAFLKEQGYRIQFDPSIIRGFDYYTGMIFEVHDKESSNRRSLIGGGRYDRLLGMIGKKDIPAVGFGLGDVTLENFLQSHHLSPVSLEEPRGVWIAFVSELLEKEYFHLAAELRKGGIQTEHSLQTKGRLGKQFETAQKKNKRYVVILGEDEIGKNEISIKDLVRGEQTKMPRSSLVGYLQNADRN